jgi:hypothetical protein
VRSTPAKLAGEFAVRSTPAKLAGEFAVRSTLAFAICCVGTVGARHKMAFAEEL